MKKFSVAIILFFAICNLSFGQNKIAKKKPLTVKELNALELEKIKATSVSKKTIPQDTSVNNKPTATTEITTVVKKDTLSISKNLAKDSVIRNVQPVTILQENVTAIIIPQPKLSKADSLALAKYYINQYIADSIRNANKHWLDSTLIALPTKKPVKINADD